MSSQGKGPHIFAVDQAPHETNKGVLFSTEKAPHRQKIKWERATQLKTLARTCRNCRQLTPRGNTYTTEARLKNLTEAFHTHKELGKQAIRETNFESEG